MSGKKGMRHYPVETKLEAVRLHFEEGRTYAEIAQALELREKGRLKTWIREYRREAECAFTKPIGRPRKQVESEQAELEWLRMENVLLKNFIPNCEIRCSRSAISGHLPPSSRIRSESNVQILRILFFSRYQLGEEGKFYVWSLNEIREALKYDADFFEAAYEISLEGNWEGRTVLPRILDDSSLAARFKLDLEAIPVKLADCHSRLLSIRAERIRPGTDDKKPTAWN